MFQRKQIVPHLLYCKKYVFLNIQMKGILQVSLSSVPSQEQLEPHVQRQVATSVGEGQPWCPFTPWPHNDCTSVQIRGTNSHAFLSVSRHNQGNDYSISPFYFSALLGNTTQAKVLFQFKIVRCLPNLGEVWIIRRVILDTSALPKSVIFAWVLDLILMDTEKRKKTKNSVGKGGT